MIRFYLLPIQELTDWALHGVTRGPKYFRLFDDHEGIVCNWSFCDYGLMPAGIICADVTLEIHNELTGYSDVLAVPADIDQQVGAAETIVQTALERLKLPGAWVNSAHTYREILRVTLCLFQFAQRYHRLYLEKVVEGDADLGMTISQLPVAFRQRLAGAAESFGWNTSDVRTSWTLRRLFVWIVAQWADAPIHFGPVVL